MVILTKTHFSSRSLPHEADSSQHTCRSAQLALRHEKVRSGEKNSARPLDRARTGADPGAFILRAAAMEVRGGAGRRAATEAFSRVLGPDAAGRLLALRGFRGAQGRRRRPRRPVYRPHG